MQVVNVLYLSIIFVFCHILSCAGHLSGSEFNWQQKLNSHSSWLQQQTKICLNGEIINNKNLPLLVLNAFLSTLVGMINAKRECR